MFQLEIQVTEKIWNSELQKKSLHVKMGIAI